MTSTMRCFLSVSLLVLLTGITGCEKTTFKDPVKVHVGNQSTKKQPGKVETKKKPPTKVRNTLPHKNTTKDGGILVSNKSVYDFGKVEPKEKIKGEFILTNKGKKPVKMKKKVRTSCSCIAKPVLEKLELAPGESGKLSFEYTTKTTSGVVLQKLFVDVTSGTPKVLTLTLKSDVRKIITIKPEKSSFKLTANAKLSDEVTLNATDGKPFKITSITGIGAKSKVSFDKNKMATTHKFTVTHDPEDLRKKPTYRRLSIRTTHPKSPVISMPFKATLPFSMRPPQKRFSQIVPGSAYKSSIQIISNFGDKFELGKMHSENSYVKVTKTTKTKDGYILNVVFELPVDDKAKSSKFVRDYLFVEIKDHPLDKQKVFFYGRVK